MSLIKKIFFLFSGFLVLSSCGSEKPKEPNKEPENLPAVKLIPMLDYSVVNTYPHDITCFTEGFLFHESKLYESTGAPLNLPQTKSSFGVVDLKTGKYEQKGELDKKTYFGEGILFLKNYMYQLTYTNQIGFIYDAKTFERTGQFSYKNKEGWGLTTDGTYIIMSDGTNNITYLNANGFKVEKTLSVKENGFAVDFINELEFIRGYIYANIWQTNLIVKIDPATSEVVAKIDLTELYNQSRIKNINLAEMNGIAYDSINDKILVTGKLWPSIYEIKFVH